MSNQNSALAPRPQVIPAADFRRRIDEQLAKEEAEGAWTNPGTTPQEIAFYAKKRAAWLTGQGKTAEAEAIAPKKGDGWAHKPNANLAAAIPNAREFRKRTPRTRRGYHHRRDNQFYQDGAHRTQLDRNQVAKILFVAEAMERRTKVKGRKNGVLGYTGLEVLRAMLKRFYNYKNGGQCDPGYDALQEVTGFCRQTIADAITRLEASGLVAVVRRLIHVLIATRCPVTGQVVQVRVPQQTSNAYMFKPVPEPKTPPPEEYGQPEGWGKPVDSLGKRAESAPQTESNPIYTKIAQILAKGALAQAKG